MISGLTRTIDLPITQEQYDKWESGALIQQVAPRLTPDQREFIMTGIVKQEWDLLEEPCL